MRRLCVVALLLIVGCGRSPSSPSGPASPRPAPANIAGYEGYWSGTINYKSCVGLHCSGRVDRSEPFSFRLRQSGNAVRGVFATTAGNVAVSGSVDADTSLRLSGFEDTGGAYGFASDVTFGASLRLDQVDGLTGTIRFAQRIFYDASHTVYIPADFEAPIVAATRGDLDAYVSDLSGTWKGLFLVRECFDDKGRPYCTPLGRDEVETLELNVAVSGSAASGELVPVFARIPVSGRALGRTLALESSRDGASISSLSATVDEFGRLTGRFSYAETFNGVTSHAEADVLSLVKLR